MKRVGTRTCVGEAAGPEGGARGRVGVMKDGRYLGGRAVPYRKTFLGRNTISRISKFEEGEKKGKGESVFGARKRGSGCG